MKSRVCKIENGIKDLNAILEESEKVARLNGFSHKQTLQLRLICEEIDGMLPNVIDDFDGDFWIEYENGVCKVNVSVSFSEFSVSKKKELINIAKNKKNAAATGIVGRIRSVLEDFFFGGNTGLYDMDAEYHYRAAEYGARLDYSCLWSLGEYKTMVKKENREEAWDELEKSIIASLADDVIVGVKGTQANIVVVKKFI